MLGGIAAGTLFSKPRTEEGSFLVGVLTVKSSTPLSSVLPRAQQKNDDPRLGSSVEHNGECYNSNKASGTLTPTPVSKISQN